MKPGCKLLTMVSISATLQEKVGAGIRDVTELTPTGWAEHRWAHGDVIRTGTGTDSVPHPFQYPFPFHPFWNPFLPVPITVPGHFWALCGTERELTRSSYRYYRSCDRSRPVPITVPSRSRGRSCPFLYRSTRSRVGVGTDLGYFGPFLPRHTTSVHLGRPNRAL